MIFGNKRKVSELVRKKIKFIAIEPKWLKMQPAPKAAVNYKPTWYKESPLYSPGNKFKFTKRIIINHYIKTQPKSFLSHFLYYSIATSIIFLY